MYYTVPSDYLPLSLSDNLELCQSDLCQGLVFSASAWLEFHISLSHVAFGHWYASPTWFSCFTSCFLNFHLSVWNYQVKTGDHRHIEYNGKPNISFFIKPHGTVASNLSVSINLDIKKNLLDLFLNMFQTCFQTRQNWATYLVGRSLVNTFFLRLLFLTWSGILVYRCGRHLQ